MNLIMIVMDTQFRNSIAEEDMVETNDGDYERDMG